MSSLNPLQPMAPWLEQAWMERYVDRALAADENAWFETYLLDKPHLLDRWSTELALRDGVNLVDRQAGTVVAAPSAPATSSPAPLAHARALAPRRRQWHLSALAASVAMAFGAGVVVNGLFRADRSDSLIADPTRIVIDASRGAPPAPNIENAASSSPFILIDALVPPDASYVAVRGPGMPEHALSVSKDGVATLLLRRSDVGRVGPLTLVIRAGGREFERPLPLRQP